MYACNQVPNFILQFIWAISILIAAFTGKSSGTDPKILSWLLIRTWDRKGYFNNFCVWVWTKMLLKDYPNGMHDVFSIYFQPEHPIAKYSVIV